MSEARLGLLIFAVEDLQRAVAFYVDAFGWEKRLEAPSYVELALPGGLRLGLYERQAFAKNLGLSPAPRPSAITATEIYVYPPDLDAAIGDVTRAGARVLDPLRRRDWGDEVAYFADPDGNVVALARPVP
jgi:predicted enzyme related to lactoylglutathione lyase